VGMGWGGVDGVALTLRAIRPGGVELTGDGRQQLHHAQRVQLELERGDEVGVQLQQIVAAVRCRVVHHL